MGELFIPKNYKPVLSQLETQRAIKKIKDYFQQELAYGLNLRRVSAPLMVFPETGLNDNLNGFERRVNFSIKDMHEREAEIVQSLAKWKRYALYKYGIKEGNGIYTDMNAIRRDEELDNIHSIYVDQWDWERVINQKERQKDFLHDVVNTIFNSIKNLSDYVNRLYREIKTDIPNEIHFITSQELLNQYPTLSPKDREHAITKKYGAVFIEEIGDDLSNGIPHDGRSPDYDDWKLNGDILLWSDILNRSIEMSSMGIRVDAKAMDYQLKKNHCDDRRDRQYHQEVLNNILPLSIGGGIGQSRLCMYFLRKAHIGEVQSSIWSDEMIKQCSENNIILL